ncbi:ADP-ribosylation factor-like protein 2 [Pezoporus occidentalis]|uniref:ADP-ribosylation factor-like protein 2 n=1 Tax=Pezoporus occidentalis TaxID=407982 RepID=UPI002F90DDED
MGLLTILKKMREKERELRLLVLGLDNAGKTTLLKRFNGEDVTGTAPTLGFNIKTLEHRGFKLNVWDVGGQSSLRSYWRNYFESTDGLVWVVDSGDRQRLQLCARELRGLLREEVGGGARERPRPASMLSGRHARNVRSHWLSRETEGAGLNPPAYIKGSRRRRGLFAPPRS